MPSILRPLLIWFAALCLAEASLLPLSALARVAASADAMAICSAQGSSGPLSLPADHLHCHYCGTDPGFHAKLPTSAVATFGPTLSYRTATPPASVPVPGLSRTQQWPRAPPA
jgi:hypothetical protein